MDIPESVMTASGAAALVRQFLARERGKLARERVYPIERDVTAEEPRIGVFVCACGANIGRVVDVPSVVEYAATPAECRSLPRRACSPAPPRMPGRSPTPSGKRD